MLTFCYPSKIARCFNVDMRYMLNKYFTAQLCLNAKVISKKRRRCKTH